jgi:hypothetical protein
MSSDQIGQWVLRILAIAGAAAVVGFGAGLITQGLSRLLTTRSVPRLPLNIIRILGAVVGGWLAAVLLFGGGPGGFGGGGGWSLFGGAGGGSGATGKAPPAAETGRGETPRETGKASPGEGITLEVEVLPRRDAYRVQAPDGGSQELNFHDLTEYLLKQKKATPPVTAVQVSPGESDPGAPAVTRVIEWARNNGLKAVTPPRPSP